MDCSVLAFGYRSKGLAICATFIQYALERLLSYVPCEMKPQCQIQNKNILLAFSQTKYLKQHFT